MMEYIKPPQIKGATSQEQIKEIYDYLVQLSRQLNFILSDIEKRLGG